MLEALVVAETVALALLALLVVGLLRSHGEVLRTLHRIGAGLDPNSAPVEVPVTPRESVAPAAPVVGVTLDDEAVSWPVTGERDLLLAFLSSGCETCQPFWAALSAGPQLAGGAEILIVTAGPDRESESLLRRLAPRDVPLVMSTRAWSDYQVPGSPHFVYVDAATATVVGEGTAPTWAQVVSLLDRAAGDRRLARARSQLPDQDAPASVDAELSAAGVAAGDPRLYLNPDRVGE